MSVRAWVNGRLLAPHEKAVSALDHGVTVGDGVFETAKIVDGHAFALTRHARRLDRSMAGLGLPPADHDVIGEGIEAVLAAGEPIRFGRLRYTVTGGVGPLGSDRLESALTYIVTAGDQARPPASAKVTVVPWTRNERAATVGLKTTSYAENVVALARAKSVGSVEAVFGNTRGELCECTGSNIFAVVDGRILTPPPDSGLLEGITRALTIEWCREEGMPVSEEALPLSVLETADEVFITSSTKDVLPVHAVDGRDLQPGPVTAQAAKVFAARAAADLDP
jgi:branched-chain amino acid aminotransferase